MTEAMEQGILMKERLLSTFEDSNAIKHALRRKCEQNKIFINR
jgi:hypothetical protein